MEKYISNINIKSETWRQLKGLTNLFINVLIHYKIK